jgi:hypothetical protein
MRVFGSRLGTEYSRKGLRSAIIFALVVWAHTVGVVAAPLGSAPLPSMQLPENLPVLSDFDGDHKLDQVILSSSGSVKIISIAFGRSSWISQVEESRSGEASFK